MSLFETLKNKSFLFERVTGGVIAILALKPDGSIGGSIHDNETYWTIVDNKLIFENSTREPTTVFDEVYHTRPFISVGTFTPLNIARCHRITELSVTREMISDIELLMFGRPRDTLDFDVVKCTLLAATIDSANYFSEHMQEAQHFTDKYSLLSEAMANRSIDGHILEFGVFSGATINHIAKLTDQKVYGFDVFDGLPENWRPGFEKGKFKVNQLPDVVSNVELVVGLFEDTLAPFVQKNPGNVSLLHVDCDLYSSTKIIFDKLGDRIVSGSIIVFDEYFNYPGWRTHKYIAFREYVTDNNIKYKYLSLVKQNQQVAVQIID